MIYKIVLLVVTLFFPVFIFAVENDVDISIQESDFSDYIFGVVGGSKHNVSFVIKNTNDDAQKVTVRMVGDNSKSLVSRTKFFVVDELDDVYREQLQQNDNNIVLFCEKKQDVAEIIKWCEGVTAVDMLLQSGETAIMPAVIDITDGEIDHVAEIVVTAKEGEEVLTNRQLTYYVPDKNIARLELQGFSLQRAFDFFDIRGWIDAGLQNQYIARITVQNTGTEKMDYAYCASVQSLWIGESVNFCNDGIISYNEEQEKSSLITVPRFGKMHVIGSVQYVDEDGVIKEQSSDPIEFIVWPIQLIVIVLIFICFCGVCVLLYKYIKKNMFGFKKKKEDKKFTGSYVVKGTDNIISIAQSYGVPWKELASVNDIEPPYILISGETINVPGKSEDKKVGEAVSGSVVVSKQQQASDGIQKNQNMEQQQNNNTTEMQSRGAQNNMAAMNQKQKMQASDMTEKPQSSVKDVETPSGGKRKVTYASPKNMMTKPASEPTTRAIDIEWMQDDEVVYSEDMQTQKKKMNVRFIVVTVLALVVVGGAVWWGTTWFLNSNNQEDVSIDTLIAEEEQSENTEMENNMSDDGTGANSSQEVADDTQSNEDGQSGDENNTESDADIASPEELTVQVLNAGAAVGAAGTVTDEFIQKGYKTTTPQNAQNDHEDVVIYYSADAKKNLEAVSVTVSEKYGTQKHEESDDITSKYKTDFVVVLGS